MDISRVRFRALLYNFSIFLFLVTLLVKSQIGVAQSQQETLRIDSISPSYARAGEMVEIRIEGSGFENGTMVYMRNQVATLNLAFLHIEYISSNEINATFEIPLSDQLVGQFNVTVWNPDGPEYTLEWGFTVYQADSRPSGDIRIDSVSPNSGNAGDILQLEIVGSGFGDDPGGIYITIPGATVISEDFVSQTLIRATIWLRCNLSSSPLMVAVTELDGLRNDVLFNAITVMETPEGCPELRLDSISPTSGRQGESLQLEISGDGFNPGTKIEPPEGIGVSVQFVDSQHLIAHTNIFPDFPAPQEVYFVVASPGEEGAQRVRFYFDVESASSSNEPSPSSKPRGIPGFPYPAIALGLIIVLLRAQLINRVVKY